MPEIVGRWWHVWFVVSVSDPDGLCQVRCSSRFWGSRGASGPPLTSSMCVCPHLCLEGSDMWTALFSYFLIKKLSCSTGVLWCGSQVPQRKSCSDVGNSAVTIAKLGQRERGMCLAHDSLLSCAVKVWSQQDYTEVKPAWLRGGSMSPFPAAFCPEVWWWFILMLFFTDAPQRYNLVAFSVIRSIFHLIVSHPLIVIPS